MKTRISSIVLCAVMLLTGCSTEKTDNVRDSSATSDSASTSAATSSTSTSYISEAPDTGQILQLLDDFGNFIDDYMYCREPCKYLDTSDYVTVERIRGVGAPDEGQPYDAYYYRVVGGEITTWDQMREAMYRLATESYVKSELIPTFELCYQVSNGNIYLAEWAGYDGRTLGTDGVYLDSIDETADGTLLSFTAPGEFEDREFTITLQRTPEGYRIDECGVLARSLLADFKVELRLDAECSSEETDNTSDSSSYTSEAPATDTEQILQLLDDFGNFYDDYMLCREPCKYLDTSDYVTVERIRGVGAPDEGQPYDAYYYRVVGGEITTWDQMREAMYRLATESYVKSELIPTFELCYQVSNGNIYLAEWAGYDGRTLGTDGVYLDSIDETADGTLLSFTAPGEFEDREFTITLQRTPEGYRIDECGVLAQSLLADFKVELRENAG